MRDEPAILAALIAEMAIDLAAIGGFLLLMAVLVGAGTGAI